MELIKDTCKWKKKKKLGRQRNKEMHRWDRERALKFFRAFLFFFPKQLQFLETTSCYL